MRISTVLAAMTLMGCISFVGGSTDVYAQTGVVHNVKEGTRDTTDALNITPNVKGAIIADKFLNNQRNHINVDTKDYVLHLKGHVYSQALRARASSVAMRKLKEMHKHYKVSNELVVSR